MHELAFRCNGRAKQRGGSTKQQGETDPAKAGSVSLGERRLAYQTGSAQMANPLPKTGSQILPSQDLFRPTTALFRPTTALFRPTVAPACPASSLP
jgi:hypothetical protein